MDKLNRRRMRRRGHGREDELQRMDASYPVWSLVDCGEKLFPSPLPSLGQLNPSTREIRFRPGEREKSFMDS